MGDALGLVGNAEVKYASNAVGLNYVEFPMSFTSGVSLQSIYDKTGHSCGFMRIRVNSGSYVEDSSTGDGILACGISSSPAGANHAISFSDYTANPQPHLFTYRAYSNRTEFPGNGCSHPVVFSAMYERGNRYTFYFRSLFGYDITTQSHTDNGEYLIFRTSPSLTVSSVDATLQVWY